MIPSISLRSLSLSLCSLFLSLPLPLSFANVLIGRFFTRANSAQCQSSFIYMYVRLLHVMLLFLIKKASLKKLDRLSLLQLSLRNAMDIKY